MMIIHAHLQVKVDQEQAFLKEAKTLVEASRAEAGNISYDLMKSTEKDGHFTMVEVWKDAESIDAHNKSEHFTAFGQKASAFMAAPMDLKVFSGEPVQL
ncbi:antibiotic biosynthesis monooxygenase [Planococcus sp. CPCC 101016]|uniref:putative quinol monooxygenase n=1 Tax=Planococcus sp. CPCC 101016 TaxID=2599617 RepID=UPI0011B3CCAD|nr:putative quinol monooxygenase [Planococcus sp. CPCC 101016]TWT08560.1 antibiotic biosynthesis monooxygenase [Planococcus sp. CPCC 101016]